MFEPQDRRNPGRFLTNDAKVMFEQPPRAVSTQSRRKRGIV